MRAVQLQSGSAGESLVFPTDYLTRRRRSLANAGLTVGCWDEEGGTKEVGGTKDKSYQDDLRFPPAFSCRGHSQSGAFQAGNQERRRPNEGGDWRWDAAAVHLGAAVITAASVFFF